MSSDWYDFMSTMSTWTRTGEMMMEKGKETLQISASRKDGFFWFENHFDRVLKAIKVNGEWR